MPRKVAYPDLADVRRLYDQGIGTSTIARQYRISKSTMLKWLHQQGFAFRPPGWRYNDLSAIIVELYRSGLSEKAVSERLGIERTVVRRRLLEAGITPRNRSESMYLRMSQTSPDERQRLTAAAHAAVRGKARSEEELCARALRRERTHEEVGKGERIVAQWLTDRGCTVTMQKAVGRYNLDLAIPPVAVEIHAQARHPVQALDSRKRMKYLTDRGWHVLHIWVSIRRFLIAEAAADDVVAFFQRSKRDESIPGAYRVIRGSGEFVAEGRGDLD